MNFENINWTDLYTSLLQNKNKTIKWYDKRNTDLIKQTFVDPIDTFSLGTLLLELALPGPNSDNIKDCLRNIKPTEFRGRVYSKTEIQSMAIILATIPRSYIFPNAVNYAKWHGYTPFLFAIMKNKYGTPYSHWDLEGLEQLIPNVLLRLRKDNSKIDPMLLHDLRAYFASDLPTSYTIRNARQKSINSKYTYKNHVLNADGIRMYGQLWICDPSIRDTNLMILDPHDWDHIPEALDDVVTPTINDVLEEDLI